jgi:hypothetical protein
MKQHHFKEIESYMHLHSKKVLSNWILSFPERFNLDNIHSLRLEESFILEGKIMFKPDITVYDDNGLKHIYEICYKSPLTGNKLNDMMYYFFVTEQNPVIFEINASYIMRQIECPKLPKMIQYGIFDDGEIF